MERVNRQINRILRRNQVRRTQRVARNFINDARTISTLILFPYDKDLDLNVKNDLNPCETASAELKVNDVLDRSLDKDNKFLKLFDMHVYGFKLKVLLEIEVEWDSTAVNPTIPKKC